MYTLASPTADLAKGNWAGSWTLSGIAAVMGVLLWLGVGNHVKINTKERIAVFGILTGTMFLAAGNSWADVITGIGTIPSSALDGAGIPALGPAGLGACLGLTAYFHPLGNRKGLTAVLALMASASLVEAGGVCAVVLNAFRITISHWTGN
ncbi:hypothetical protein [Streptomyces prunicolor]|uniref:hypothetical protein n=1 Tax=Streptomyces prunicolor TaxID=67348 RepID=UPI0003828175|nr:hypothetical protein [Streptomyces prunicolor]